MSQTYDYGLVDAKIRASDKDLPVQLHILAGYNVKENNNRLPEKIQETFLQLRSQPFT